MTAPDSAQITQLLIEWRGGDEKALAHLMPLVYADLQRIARRQLRAGAARTLSATELVHEAYMKLLGPAVEWQDRAHFFAIAAKQMRHVLVDHARHKQRAKRGGGMLAVTLSVDEPGNEASLPDILVLDQLLDQLATLDPRKRDVLELHYFGGLTHLEMAQVLAVSEATVDRDLRFAKAWLRQAMQN